ncbi:hypothetical protein [Pseudanabaena sp. FACHB-2040]|uniref:hypothetical protein n=1 Tax=Pseudanabaena sp. FACHB-2040 TaxID=2692859 RepID=UPI0016829270|nr:hypothetical protein [Pseudanabaena sp. FACHB-2040]MBD2258076.1 hypothetical protein [Pseudanabaena sp. FACHB-2040]
MVSWQRHRFRTKMMLLKWLRQARKTVFFNQNALDQTLLAAVKAELSRQPGLSFSSLCKEALHQLLLGTQPYSSQTPSPIENQIESLQAQLLSVEQRFFSQEKKRLERLETQLQQLTLQVAQLGGTVPASLVSLQGASEPMPYREEQEPEELPEEDPVLARLSGLIDDF